MNGDDLQRFVGAQNVDNTLSNSDLLFMYIEISFNVRKHFQIDHFFFFLMENFPECMRKIEWK